MREPMTLKETVPQVINGIKDLQKAIREEKINTYQTGLILESLLYSLEHPEKHFTDGSVAF